MTTVAFLTSEELAALTPDDHLAINAVAEHDVRVVPAIWTDAHVDYRAFDAVVIRSTWDWYRDARAFAARLESIARATRLLNARAWDWLDKRYLLALAARGVRTIPMSVVPTREALEQKLAEYSDREIVLKPATSAGGQHTWRLRANDHARAIEVTKPIFPNDAVIVQTYVEAIENDGEWSLIFFDHEFSHALKKRPARGEFRVQAEFGGSVHVDAPPDDVIAMAKKALEASEQKFLYARVDGVLSAPHGGFCVTELECVEPELFFRVDADSPERFARALVRRLAE